MVCFLHLGRPQKAGEAETQAKPQRIRGEK
jgi:hypothetical protein